MLEGGKVLQVLERFYVPLAYAIQNPASIPVGEYPYPYVRATRVPPVKMLPDEVDAWNRAFDITGKILAIGKGIAIIDTDILLTELDRVSYNTIMDRSKNKKGRMPRPDVSDFVLYGGRYSKFFPCDVEGVEWQVQPYAHLERRADGSGLYTASMQLRFFAMDKRGRIAVAVPRPIKHGFPAYSNDAISPGAVVAPYQPIDARLSFNTTIDPERENKFEVYLDNNGKFRLRTELHNPKQIEESMIPDNERVRLFFSQIATFLAPMKDGDKTIDNLFQTEGRV